MYIYLPKLKHDASLSEIKINRISTGYSEETFPPILDLDVWGFEYEAYFSLLPLTYNIQIYYKWLTLIKVS